MQDMLSSLATRYFVLVLLLVSAGGVVAAIVALWIGFGWLALLVFGGTTLAVGGLLAWRTSRYSERDKNVD